jgi:hypothetical protein
MYLKNAWTGSRTKEDLSQESTRENTRKESDSQKDVIFEPQKWMTVPMKKKMSQSLEHKYNAKQEESILPTQYLPWKEVFEQKAAERFPGKRPWDHAIELRDDFKPKKGKIYPLNITAGDNSKTNTIILRIWKLLQKIHFRIRRNRTTTSRINQERQDMELD